MDSRSRMQELLNVQQAGGDSLLEIILGFKVYATKCRSKK